MAGSRHQARTNPQPKPKGEFPDADITQIRFDLEGCERLQTMQFRLLLEIRRQLEAFARSMTASRKGRSKSP